MIDQKKTLKTKIAGVGEIEISILQVGKDWWLKEIESFVKNSNEKFYAISCVKTELKTPIHFQRALQHFINHIQMGGEEQKCNLIQSHFRNWVNKQNSSLKYIISNDGQSNTNESKQSLRDSVKEEFDRRHAARR